VTDRTVPQYDFYATPPATAQPSTHVPAQPSGSPLAPSAPVFGAPAVNQFGTPIGTPGATLPAAAVPAQQRVTGGGVHVPPWVWRFVAPLAVLVVLGLFGVGKLGFLDVFHADLEAPETLAGMPQTTEDMSEYIDLLSSYGAPDGSYAIQGYEDADGFAMVVALDAELGSEELLDMVNADAAPAGPVTIGTATCAEHPVLSETMTMCARAGDDRTVVVLHGPADAVTTSTTLSEAWSHFG
jgi:hypothetical protein